MKWITVEQPYATLIAMGEIHVLPRQYVTASVRPGGPREQVVFGERLVIKASAFAPVDEPAGDWRPRRTGPDSWEMFSHAEGYPGCPEPVPLPLDRRLCTVRLADLLPIVDMDDPLPSGWVDGWAFLEPRPGGYVRRIAGHRDISKLNRHPLPFTSGMWAWVFSDVVPWKPKD